MNQVQVITLLHSLDNIPVYYDHTDPATALPYIGVHVDQGSNFGADNHVYVQGWDFTVDLYTKGKSPDTEKLVKDLLNNAGIYWSRSETYLNDEDVYEIEFMFSVWGDEVDPIPPTPPTPPEPEDGDDDGE